MTFFERQTRLHAEAQARRDTIADFNAVNFANAAIVRAREKEQRDRDARAHAEVVNQLLQPGALGALIMAKARLNVPLVAGDKAPNSFCWMPKGDHEINAGRQGGGTWSGLVHVDEISANNVIASFTEMTRAGFSCFVDFGHAEREAAAWVGGFSWDRLTGIRCHVTWTTAGETAVNDRLYISFSPTFTLSEDGHVAGLVQGGSVGALVNTPAFRSMPAILSAAGRSLAASTMRDALLAQGQPREAADRVARAIDAGCDAQAVALLMRSIF